MPSRRHLACLLVLLLVLGNAACLQIVAWTGMVASRAMSGSVSSALTTTFDGSRPCALCRTAQALADDGAATTTPGKQPAPGKAVKKADLLPGELALVVPTMAAAHATRELPRDVSAVAQCSHRPDVPPPRVHRVI